MPRPLGPRLALKLPFANSDAVPNIVQRVRRTSPNSSSTTNALLLTMTLKQFALDYNVCSIDELKKFLKARTGEVYLTESGKNEPGKEWYVKQLHATDSNAQFNFLGLAPELRNLIYRELLTLRPINGQPGRSCWPYILLPSKQTQEEGHGILCGDNSFTVRLSQTNVVRAIGIGANARVIHEETDVKAEVDGVQVRTFHHDRSSTAPTRWCSHLRKAYNLRIVIKLEYKDQIGVARPQQLRRLFNGLNFMLYSLCSFLAESNRLKTLKVRPRVSELPGFSEVASEFLWPLTLMRPPKNCHISGVPKSFALHIVKEMRLAPSHTTDVLAKIGAVRESIGPVLLPYQQLLLRQSQGWDEARLELAEAVFYSR